MKYLSAILITLAALFKSVADTLDDHFTISVFRHMNPKVWDANYSEVKTWWITGYKPDPWHLANSMMVIAFICAVVFYRPIFWKGRPVHPIIQIVILGIWFNFIFSTFYSKIWL